MFRIQKGTEGAEEAGGRISEETEIKNNVEKAQTYAFYGRKII
jgi:hypothetical protein